MAYSLNQHKPRPDIKVGLRLNDRYADTLLPRIKELLRHKHQGFPGSQPVDFEKRHIDLLEKEDYYVRDKTDGKRYIMFFTAVDGGTAFMMDELCKFRILTEFKLPLRSNQSHIHNETMMDGEMVVELENNKQCYRYLIFDLMVLNGNSLIERPYNKRLGTLTHDVLEPLNALLEKNAEMKKKMPFRMEIKSMELSYGLMNVLQKIPSLKHGNDGLIFVPVNHPYEPGSCKKLLLWKPITQLTVDFMIKVFYFKEEKKYQLLIFDDSNHRVYDYLTLKPDIAIQWQRNSPDGNIATFWYDKHWKTTIYREGMAPHSRDGGWRFIRFAPEKNIADNERVIERVWKSIQNAVSQDMLENRQPIIRENWKRRHSIQSPDAQPLPQTPLFGSASSSISPNIFWNNNNYNNNTQLVSPSISSSESFALLKERRPSEEQVRDQNTKGDLTESMEAITRFKFSQLLVTPPGKKSPTEKTLSYNNSDGNRENFKSYFPPVYERKSPDQIGSSRPNMKPKDFRPLQAFDPPVQEKKSPDQRVPIRPFIDTTCPPLDNSMVSRSEKRSSDVRYSPSDKEEDPMEISVEIMQPEPSPKTSPTLDRDHSLPKSDAFLKDSGNDIINRSSKLLEQSDEEESNDEPVYESNNEMLSDDDLSRKEHHRISISLDTAAIVNYESSRNLSEQYSNHQRFEHESNFEKGKLETQSLISKGQNNSQDHSDYWANFEEDEEDDEENEKRKEKEDCNRNRNSIEENNPPIQVKRNLPSLKQNQLPTSEQSQFNQNIQDAQTFQQQKQVNSLEDNQPIKQIQPRSSLEQDNRLIPERSQNILTENGNIFSNSQFQSQNKNQTIAKSSQKKTPENQGMSFHPNVSSQKILVSQLKNRSEPLLSQNNTQVLIQENRKISYNDVQHASTQIKSPISRDQIQENSIPTTSSLQRYQMSDNRFDSTQMHVPNRPIQSQLSLQSTNQITQLISQTQDMPPIPSKRKIISQDNLSESQQNIMLSQSQLSERQRPRQESRSTITPQLSRRQTISDSRSIVASQPQQIHTPHSVPIQMRAPLQENRLMNPPQTQTQLMDSQSIFQSQVSTQDTRFQVQQTLLEYQQSSDGQYIDKQRDLNMEQERFNHNNPNFQQAIKPVPRRHTLSGANNSLYQQNFTDPYHHQRQFSTMVSSYPPPRQEILSSSIPFTSQPMSSPQHSLPLHSPILSQIPEEYSRNDPANVKIINFTSQKPSETTQQNVTNSSVPPVLRPTPQKRKSKGALDFILNTSGGSNLKRSKYDDEDNDVN